MDVRPSTALSNALTRAGDAAPATRPAAIKPTAMRPMDDARAAARAAFARMVAPPARIDTAQRLAAARQADPQQPLPRGSLINVVV